MEVKRGIGCRCKPGEQRGQRTRENPLSCACPKAPDRTAIPRRRRRKKLGRDLLIDADERERRRERHLKAGIQHRLRRKHQHHEGRDGERT